MRVLPKELTDQTNGRDKLFRYDFLAWLAIDVYIDLLFEFRLVQYVSRFSWSLLDKKGKNALTVEKLKRLEDALSMARKRKMIRVEVYRA